MGKRSLKTKLRLLILGLLILGVLMLFAINSLALYFLQDYSVSMSAQMFSEERNDLLRRSTAIQSQQMGYLYQSAVNSMLQMSEFAAAIRPRSQELYNSSFSFPVVSQVQLYLNESLGPTLPGWYTPQNMTTEASGWYINPNITEMPANATNDSEFQNMMLIFTSLASDDEWFISWSYFYESKLMQLYPLVKNDFFFLEKFTTLPCDTPYFTVECLPDQIQTYNEPNLVHISEFRDVYAVDSVLGSLNFCKMIDTNYAQMCNQNYFPRNIIISDLLADGTSTFRSIDYFMLDRFGNVGGHRSFKNSSQTLGELLLNSTQQPWLSDTNALIQNMYDRINQQQNIQTDVYNTPDSKMAISMVPMRLYLGEMTSHEQPHPFTFIVGATLSYDQFDGPVQEVKRKLTESFWVQFGVFLGCGSVFLLLAWAVTVWTTSLIINPIAKLADATYCLVERIQPQKVHIFRASSKEAKALFHQVRQLILTIDFANDTLSETFRKKGEAAADAQTLMRFAQAHQVFADSNNARAMSVCLNNIGHLHLRSYCFALAVDSFTKSKIHIKALSDHELPPQGKAFALAHRSYHLGLALLGRGQIQEIINLNSSIFSELSTRSDFASARSQFVRAIRYFEYVGGFPDFLILTRILISSAHLMESSALRAQNQLFEAQKLLGDLEKEKPIQRASLPPIPTCILRQRVQLQRAKIFLTMGNYTDAVTALADQMHAGPIFDSNLRYEALTTLADILKLRQIPIPKQVQYLLGRFDLRGKDFVFLLNYSASMKKDGNLRRARQALKDIFSSLLGPRDRVALLTFGKNVYRVFSLVEKTQNTRQLQNQLDGLRAPHGPYASLLRGFQEALLQLRENGRHDHKAWIVLLTDTEDQSPPNKSPPKLSEVAQALKRFQASAFVLAFSQNPSKQLIELAASTPESILLADPEFPDIATGFEAVSPIHRPSQSLLLERIQSY